MGLINKDQLLCSFVIIISISFNLSAQSLPFQKLTTTNGLSNNYVNNVIQDKTGFLWFSTDDGLNRFDGYEFKIFRSNQSDKNSVSDNSTLALTEDENGKIWIGTKNGFINCYDPLYNKFIRWDIKQTDEKDNPINVIHIDNKKNVWAGTYRNGLYRLNPKTGEIKNWRNNPADSNSISNNYVSSIVEDDKNVLWIGTFYGLNRFNPSEPESNFTRYLNIKDNPSSLGSNTLWSITQSIFDKNIFFIGTSNGITVLNTADEKFRRVSIPNPQSLMFGTGAGSVIEEFVNEEKILWINSYAGLLRYNQNQNRFDRYTKSKDDVNSLLSNQINQIYKDRSGVMWIATDKGLNYFTDKNIKFNNTFLSSNQPFDIGELSKLNIKAIKKTSDGTIWFGTDQGLYYSVYSADKMQIKKHYDFAAENIWSLAEGNKDELYIGTYGSGLFLLNYKTNKVSKKPIIDELVKSSSKDFIKSLCRDSRNRLWAGFWGVGLARLDLLTGEVKHWLSISHETNSLSYDDVWVILEDSKSRIWVGTNGGGLDYFDETTERFSNLNSNSKSNLAISSNGVYSITESRMQLSGEHSSVLWVGTNNGLNKIIVDDSISQSGGFPKIKSINIYTTQNGLIDNSIKSIVEDEKGNLWLGTSAGITLFNTAENSFTNFSNSDGVLGIDFNLSSTLKAGPDLIIMGSTEGLNLFNPLRISQSRYNPPLAITDFQIFNNSVEPDSNSVLLRSIFNTQEIILSHTQNVFSFQFSAFDYNNPGSINYSYIMEGFDQVWIKGGTRRFITYTNLNPGEYTFKVKSTNSDGVWCDNEKSIRIIITPPWWQTGWAILLYFVVFILGVWMIIKFQNYRTKLQHELKFRELESYHLREIEQMKSRFFANLSHEFRTPLMLIKGPLEALLNGKIKENISDYYHLLLRNTVKLQKLIDQLLDLSHLEAESIPLKLEPHDLVDIVKSGYLSLMQLAEEKNINFSFSTANDSIIAMIDKDKLEKIIDNLLTNAFKFTPNSGSISIDITTSQNNETKNILISIKDSGMGIPKESQEKIFDRFYQVDNSSKRNIGGSGIGLSLVKELVLLHNWNIEVKSSENTGTEFILTIPFGVNTDQIIIYNDNDIKSAANTDKKDKAISLNDDWLTNNNSDKPVVLVVEDSEDVRTYVHDILISDYDVLLAESGDKGLEFSINNQPDLIVSDVMMPGMDGFEFCKRAKSDWKTSHIPVILLTAKAAHQNKLEGLELGADDYITKPFDYKELLIRIKNLIDQRKKLKEKFSKDINTKAEIFSENSSDKEFIQKTIDVIEKNIHNEKFDSEALAKELYVSRSQLNRKLHSITGQGPGEFLRIYKLKRGAQMILENKLSITQIAYEVGFGSPAQFTRAFQKYFKYLPSEFHKQFETKG